MLMAQRKDKFAMFLSRPLILAGLPLACAFVAPAPSFAQTAPTDTGVKDQTTVVNTAIGALKKAIGEPADFENNRAADEKLLRDQIAKLTVKSPLDDFKAVTQALSDRLLNIRNKRDFLASAVATLNASVRHPAYTPNVMQPTQGSATEALTNARAEMERAPYQKYLGESNRPGDAVKAVQEVYATLIKRAALSAFGTLESDPPSVELLEKLPAGLEQLVKEFQVAKDLAPFLEQLMELPINRLLPDGENAATYAAFADKVAALKKREKAIAGKVPEWVNAIKEQVDKRTMDVVKKANNIRRHQPAAMAFGIVERTNAATYQDSARPVAVTWKNHFAAISERYKDEADKANTAVSELNTSLEELNANITMLTGLLGIGSQELVTQEVRLSYFPDVNQLIHILNPTAKLIDPTSGQAASDVAQKRVTLRQQDAKLLDARQRVADVKTRILRIEAELAQAQVAAQRTAQAFKKAEGQLLGLTDARTKLETTLAGTTDAVQHAKLQAQIDGIKEKEEVHKEAVAAADTDNKSAQDRLKALSDEKTGLPNEIKEARADLKKEEDIQNELRSALPGSAQDESDAFAVLRANAPFYKAEPLFDDPDPLRRVFIWGNTDSRTLYLRGDRDDVAAAREAVAEFDKPIPFTKLSFLTMQLNGDDKAFKLENRDGKLDPNAQTAFAIVEDNLDAVRTGTKLVTDSLRNAIAAEINAQVKANANPPQEGMTANKKDMARMKRYQFYSPRIKEALGFRPSWWTLENENNSNNENTLEEFSDTSVVTRYILPDPIRLTTLGEMIFIASLGSKKSRETIESNFRKEIDAKREANAEQQEAKEDANTKQDAGTDGATGSRAPKSKKKENLKPNQLIDNLLRAALAATLPKSVDSSLIPKLFPGEPGHPNIPDSFTDALTSILRILGLNLPGTDTVDRNNDGTKKDPTMKPQQEADEEPMTPAQKEILDALLAKARTDVAGTVYNLTRQLDQMPEEIRYQDSELAKDLRERYLPLIGWLVASPSGKNPFDTLDDTTRKTLQEQVEGKKLKLSWRLIGLYTLLGESVLLEEANSNLTDLSSEKLKHMDRMAFEIARQQYVANPLSKATGRIEAADMMIRDMIDAFNDDLKRTIQMPAMEAIRNAIRTQLVGVSFGGVEETSFLAANRRVARVDPVGSGALTVEEKANFAEAAKNLSDLILKQQEREKTRDSILGAASTAGAANALGASQLAATGLGLTSLLGSLLGSTNDPQTTGSETYSISSGNLYKITPIFGPSGQGMRFNFDFVGTTRLREPGGTTNPAIPRIERHTINTEVGLSNLELRQIASFDANYQLGIPTKYSGGIAPFNGIPGLNRIPLLGYFSVRQGQPALRQKSIIMAQSVMYPTIGDIAGLMLDTAALPVTFSPEPPAATRKQSELSPFMDKPQFINVEYPLVPNQVIGIRVPLRRPLQKDATITLNIQACDKLALVGTVEQKISQTLRRGQDAALFYVKVTAKEEELKNPVYAPEQQKQLDAIATDRKMKANQPFVAFMPKEYQDWYAAYLNNRANEARQKVFNEAPPLVLQQELNELSQYQAQLSALPADSEEWDKAAKQKNETLTTIGKLFVMAKQYIVAELSDDLGRTERLPFVVEQSPTTRFSVEDLAVEWKTGTGRHLNPEEYNSVRPGEKLTALIKARYPQEGAFEVMGATIVPATERFKSFSTDEKPAEPLDIIDGQDKIPHPFAVQVPETIGYATMIVEIRNASEATGGDTAKSPAGDKDKPMNDKDKSVKSPKAKRGSLLLRLLVKILPKQ